MGRYSALLATRFADFAGVGGDERALDVGCGPGALTAELVARVGAGRVVAVAPSHSFVAAARERHPGVQVELAAAEHLPFADDAFDIALAQLVVHFMADPVAGLREMGRVVRPGGTVAACVWDTHGGTAPLSQFWDAVRAFDGAGPNEDAFAGAREGHLGELFRAAGFDDVEESSLTVASDFETFEEWWGTYELGVGPAGTYVASLDDARRTELRELARTRMPDPPFTVTGRAWAA